MRDGRETVRRAAAVIALVLAGPALTASAGAQIRASELGTVSQVIDGTRIAVEYSRPRARGRTDMFGGEVKWQEVWTPGANYATTFETNKNVKLNGQLLPKGKYSLWFIVRQAGDWTAVFDTTPRRFHYHRRFRHRRAALLQRPFDIGGMLKPLRRVLFETPLDGPL